MTELIRAAESSQNAMLESPTGTGKTLSLLCGSLAWLKHHKTKVNPESKARVIYCSRTHSQLGQVVRELKKTSYRPDLNILGSRSQLCINPYLNTAKGGQLDVACMLARKQGHCPFYNNRSKGPELIRKHHEPMDIEDLYKLGQNHQFCPFYVSREKKNTSELLLMPYNYALDPKIRDTVGVNYSDSLLIFDEAHNVGKVSEEGSSFEISVQDLQMAIQEITEVKKVKEKGEDGHETLEEIQEAANEVDENSFQDIKGVINNFIEYLKEKDDIGGDNVKSYKGREIFNFFSEGTRPHSNKRCVGEKQMKIKCGGGNIGYEEFKESPGELDAEGIPIERNVDRPIGEGLTRSNYMNYLGMAKPMIQTILTMRSVSQLDYWCKAIEVVFFYYTEYLQEGKKEQRLDIDDFSVRIEEIAEESGGSGYEQLQRASGVWAKKKERRKLCLWCFNPGLGFKQLFEKKPRCLVLTSGTLSPMDSLEKELRIPFPVRIESPHVITSNQVSIGVLKKGREGRAPFNFNYQNRDNKQIQEDMGEAIQEMARNTTGGILIFFPSYYLLNSMFNYWGKKFIAAIEREGKPVFREPKNQSEYLSTIQEYYDSLKRSTGAVLMAVCRGKISEGLDFADNAARLVVMIGMPFAAAKDPKVMLKQEYLDNLKKVEKKMLSGREWYSQQALRAINQSIGRVIRHVADYGAIVLLDDRMSFGSNKAQISKWLRGQIKDYNSTAQCLSTLSQFFLNISKLQVKANPAIMYDANKETDSDLKGIRIAEPQLARETNEKEWLKPQNARMGTHAQGSSHISTQNLRQIQNNSVIQNTFEKPKFLNMCYKSQTQTNPVFESARTGGRVLREETNERILQGGEKEKVNSFQNIQNGKAHHPNYPGNHNHPIERHPDGQNKRFFHQSTEIGENGYKRAQKARKIDKSEEPRIPLISPRKVAENIKDKENNLMDLLRNMKISLKNGYSDFITWARKIKQQISENKISKEENVKQNVDELILIFYNGKSREMVDSEFIEATELLKKSLHLIPRTGDVRKLYEERFDMALEEINSQRTHSEF